MLVVGQSIKSFNPETLIKQPIDVQNYPIRKQSDEEVKWIGKIKRLRRIQLAMSSLNTVRSPLLKYRKY